MIQSSAEIVDHRPVGGGYRKLTLLASDIAPLVEPGQFVHLRVPGLRDAVLRRPFSVFDTDASSLSIIYKAVGKGTDTLSHALSGSVDLIGPLGTGFPAPADGKTPLLIAGGYGMAALYLLAKNNPGRGIAFFGGRTAADILCIDEFEAAGWPVKTATEDGSMLRRGLVTDILKKWLAENTLKLEPELFACGPNGMLKAVAGIAAEHGWTAWISMDRYMGCGVGACLTCVQKVRDEKGGWTWARVCKEGPVFNAQQIIWNDEA